MHLNISGHHIEVTQALRTYAEEKFLKVKAHFNNIINIDMVLEVEKSINTAEATVHISGANIFARVQSDDMYHSILELVKKIEVQVIKHKEIKHKHR